MAATGTSVGTGTVLAGRWVIEHRIGSGASSRVYLAKDMKLDLAVAVKVLHESLASDAAFLSQFEQEAHAVSVLEHDHIVRFYDSGTHRVDDLEVPFIVTALMQGGSLRAMLEAGRRLSVSQAVAIGRDAAQALTVAHEAGLVHRDVKPANLLFDSRGEVALADFGIARAIAAATSTEPMGSAAGTTRYASPEQMQGRAVDGRSDVYSLALVLMESVTGVVPLLADTIAGTVALRADSRIDVSVDFGALREPLLAATETDVRRRCEAAELVTRLDSAAQRLDRPAAVDVVPLDVSDEDTSELRVDRGPSGVTVLGPAVAAGGAEATGEAAGEEGDPGDERGARQANGATADGSAAADASAGPATVGGARAAQEAGAGSPRPHGADPDDTDPDDQLLIDLGATGAAAVAARTGDDATADVWGADAISTADEHARLAAAVPSSHGPVEPLDASRAPGAVSHPADDAPKRTARSRKRLLLTALAVLLVLAAAVAGWWFLLRTPTHPVPDWVGGDVGAAAVAAEENGWEVSGIEETRRDGTAAGEVLAQSPEAGTELAEGESVSLLASLGPTLTALPEIAGMPEADALAALEAAGLVPGNRGGEYNEDAAAGIVLLWAPAEGSEPPDAEGLIPKETPIDYIVSEGPAPRVVPGGLVGASRSDAAAAIESVQLVADVSSEYSDTVAKGIVMGVGVAAGTEVPRGSVVPLVVSEGPRPIVVPNVVGRTGSAAAAALEEAGFTVSGIEGSPSGIVLATDPVAGESRPPGSSVRVFTRQ